MSSVHKFPVNGTIENFHKQSYYNNVQVFWVIKTTVGIILFTSWYFELIILVIINELLVNCFINNIILRKKVILFKY